MKTIIRAQIVFNPENEMVEFPLSSQSVHTLSEQSTRTLIPVESCVDFTGGNALTPVSRIAQISESDSGMSTVEYAIGTIAAAAFAGILYKIVTGGEIFGALTNIIMHALQSVG